MPLHDVKCSECGHVQEIFFQPADEPETYECAICEVNNPYKYSVLPGKPIIDMQERTIEKRLERDAGDGLF